MGRAIAAVVAGYATMFLFVFVSFSLAYVGLGADRAFAPGTFEVSGTWIAASLGLSFLAALTGGWVCRRVGRTPKPVMALAALVVVLGAIISFTGLRVTAAPSALARAGRRGSGR